MRIGIDIDDVLKDTLKHVNLFFTSKTGEIFPKELFTTYNWWEIWGNSKEEAIKVFDDYADSHYHHNTPVIDGAVEAVNEIIKKHEVFIITSRPIRHNVKTLEWLRKNFPEADLPLIHSTSIYEGKERLSKIEICKKNKISLMIEDNAKYALECAEHGVMTLLFDAPWNQECKHDNLIRVGNWKRESYTAWQEALQVIEKLQDSPNKQS